MDKYLIYLTNVKKRTWIFSWFIFYKSTPEVNSK